MTPVEKHQTEATELAGLVKSSAPDKGTVSRLKKLDAMREAKAQAQDAHRHAGNLVAALDRLIQASK